MNSLKMNKAIDECRNALENIYRAGYDAGRRDADWERNEGYAVNKLNQLASALRSEIKERGASSYIADGLWVALHEIDGLKEYIGSGGDEER